MAENISDDLRNKLIQELNESIITKQDSLLTSNVRQFFDMVRQMRIAQKDYFRTRDKRYLELSKHLEKNIDYEIARIEAMERTKRNPELF